MLTERHSIWGIRVQISWRKPTSNSGRPGASPRSVGAGDATVGAAFLNSINVVLAAPQASLIVDQTDFYDDTAAFTWSIGAGVLFRVAEQVDLNAQIGLRLVSGLSEVDQLVGTGLEEINNDTGRMTFPIVIGVRFRFR